MNDYAKFFSQVSADWNPMIASDVELFLWDQAGRPTQADLPHALTVRIPSPDDISDVCRDCRGSGCRHCIGTGNDSDNYRD